MQEEKIIEITKKSQETFIEHSTLLGLLLKKKDSFIITNKRILIKIRDKVISNVAYNDFSKIRFNPKNDILTYQNFNNETLTLSLQDMRITYEEIQYLKSKLNT